MNEETPGLKAVRTYWSSAAGSALSLEDAREIVANAKGYFDTLWGWYWSTASASYTVSGGFDFQTLLVSGFVDGLWPTGSCTVSACGTSGEEVHHGQS